jgi:hypothetical protein
LEFSQRFSFHGDTLVFRTLSAEIRSRRLLDAMSANASDELRAFERVLGWVMVVVLAFLWATFERDEHNERDERD